jgi:hypothetical protein
VIESPDSDTTTVIYLLSKPVRCVDLSFSGWDRALGTGSSVLELNSTDDAAPVEPRGPTNGPPANGLALAAPGIVPRATGASGFDDPCLGPRCTTARMELVTTYARRA